MISFYPNVHRSARDAPSHSERNAARFNYIAGFFGSRALDVGAMHGDWLSYIERNWPDAELHGVDLVFEHMHTPAAYCSTIAQTLSPNGKFARLVMDLCREHPRQLCVSRRRSRTSALPKRAQSHAPCNRAWPEAERRHSREPVVGSLAKRNSQVRHARSFSHLVMGRPRECTLALEEIQFSNRLRAQFGVPLLRTGRLHTQISNQCCHDAQGILCL